MIDWILFGYFMVAMLLFIIGLSYGEEHNLFTSAVFGLLWPLLWFIWLIRVIIDAATYP